MSCQQFVSGLIQRATPRFLKLISFATITALVLGCTAWFLAAAPNEVPMGDSYIHFVYARNLALHGELAFNPGMQEGIGTTSILWVLMLAGAQVLGITPVVAAKALGVVLLIASGLLIYEMTLAFTARLSRPRRHAVALCAALLAVLPGNSLWIALSGMETVLFTALGLIALHLYYRERWIGLGVALGLLALTRSEGLLLAGVVGALELLRRRRLQPWVWQLGLPMLMLLLPWLGYLQSREGAPVPSSFQGKRYAMTEGAANFTETRPELAWVLKFSPALHFVSWIGYGTLFMTGSATLPGPVATLSGPVAADQFTIPLAGGSAILLAMLALAFVAGRRLWRARRRFTLHSPASRLLLAFLCWTAAHNLLYAIVLPIPGAAGRYGPMNHLLVWEGLLVGTLLLAQRGAKIAAALTVVTLVGLSLQYWHTVYADNIAYMHKVRLPAVTFVEAELPPGAAIATTDLGPLRYYADHPTIDLFGFVNNDIVELREQGGSYADYLISEEIDYLFLFIPADDGDGQLFNYSHAAGLFEDERLRLSPMATFSIPTAEWSRSSPAVNNYLPAIQIVHVEQDIRLATPAGGQDRP